MQIPFSKGWPYPKISTQYQEKKHMPLKFPASKQYVLNFQSLNNLGLGWSGYTAKLSTLGMRLMGKWQMDKPDVLWH